MKTRKLLLILFALIISFGCTESFLETDQQGVTKIEDFYKTDEQALSGILGCYDVLQMLYTGVNIPKVEFCYIMALDILSDDAYSGGSTRGDVTLFDEFDEFRYGSENTLVADYFDCLYKGIYRANMILENVADDSDKKKIIIAEAKALRAYFYFELVVGWGDVPLVTKTLSPSEYAQSRAPKSEIWNQIEQDLTEAIPDLPLKSLQSIADKARISKGTAQSILGKAYLFQEKFTEAAAEFQKVIDSGNYDLYPDFSRILRWNTELGIESIFEVMLPNNAGSVSQGEAGQKGRFYAPRGSGWFVGSTKLKIWNGGLNFIPGKLGLWQAFVDAGDSVRRFSTIISEEEVIALGGKMRNLAYATPQNPRGTLAWSNDPCMRLTYTSWKDEVSSEIPSYTLNYGTNHRLIRYADVLLMAAEAYNRKPNPDDIKALEYLSKVRERAQLPELSLTGDGLFEAIKLERRLELAFEGHRFQDLIRWGDATTVLADEGKQIPRGDGTYLNVPDAGFKPRNMLFPIPAKEMGVNPNIIENNPGY